MQVKEFKRILSSFADQPDDVEVSKGRVVAQIRDDIVEASLDYDGASNEIVVIENGERHSALKWLTNRVARLPQLAERIISATPKQEFFVVPSGRFRDDIAASQGEDIDEPIDDVVATLLSKTSRQVPGTTTVMYLTSDAGEGKTTLINHIARQQAEQYKAKKSPFLIVPIPLGGKAFLNFDDVVIAALVNRLRFTYYYYEAFLELVRIGAIVPAFDGFEEMFVEGSSGEAVSALGNLVDSLDSCGSVLVAARKAFFEYQSFRTQARLFDAIGDKSASFSRLAIDRWQKRQFIEYSELRGESRGEEIYEAVSTRLGYKDHPLLTRAVLVKRLFDIVQSGDGTPELLEKLGAHPQDYFFTFVDAIVKREAFEKWRDKSGDAHEPLMTVEEHHELLSMLAKEMWQSSTYALRYDLIDIIVDLFLDAHKKGPVLGRQIKERIRQHSLLAVTAGKTQSVSFDHDDFRKFYLGEALGRLLVSNQKTDLYLFLSIEQVPAETCDQAAHYLSRLKGNSMASLQQLSQLSRTESALSFVKENCGALALRILSSFDSTSKTPFVLEFATIPANGLAGRKIANISFENCYVLPTSLYQSQFADVVFKNCEFERIELQDDQSLLGISFQDCRFGSLMLIDSDSQAFGPAEIEIELERLGAKFIDMTPHGDTAPHSPSDQRIKLVEKLLRIFLRTTQVDEDIFKLRFGRLSAGEFLSEVLPELLKIGVIEEVPYRGGGVQRRFKLRTRMEVLQSALAEANGNYESFIRILS